MTALKQHLTIIAPGTCVNHCVVVSLPALPWEPAARAAHLRPDMTGRLSMVKRSHRPDPCAAVIDTIRACRDEVRA